MGGPLQDRSSGLGGNLRFELPSERRRYRFPLTPLADMMFQLLVFFMLSASLTPYALLDLVPGGLRGDSAQGDGASAPVAATAPQSTAVWTIRPDGAIIAHGQLYAPDRLTALAAALGAQTTRNVLVVAGPGVTVEMTARVLEALAAAQIPSVQISGGAA